MGTKNYKPTSPARRYYSGYDFKEITKGKKPDGVEQRFVGKRDKPAHAIARRLDWGDEIGRAHV